MITARRTGALRIRDLFGYGDSVSSFAETQGIRVVVRSRYVQEQSEPARFVFAYTIRITNTGTVAAKLVSRHWVITDGDGNVQEVRGDGVVGAQPVLQRSSCRLEPGSDQSDDDPHGISHLRIEISNTD